MGSDATITSEGWIQERRNGRLIYPNLPFVFWQHPVNQTIPNNTWTPLALNTIRSQGGQGVWSTYVAASTTIAAGSDSQALPQATINVASTTGFSSDGFIVIRISGTDRVVRYTGKTATTFTGCTLGVGNMATGQAVAQAQVAFGVAGSIGPAIAEVAWPNNNVGLRGIRVKFQLTTAAFFLGATTVIGAVAAADPLLHIQTAEQPAFPPAGGATNLTGNIIEVYQSSGNDLDSVATGNLDAPRLVAQVLSGFPVNFW